MKMWLSGPMYDHDNANIAAFEKVAKVLRQGGHEVFMPQDVPPAQHDGEPCPAGPQKHGHHASCFMRTRIPAMLKCDAVMMVDGWVSDRYSRAEKRAAVLAGLKTYTNVIHVPRIVAPRRDWDELFGPVQASVVEDDEPPVSEEFEVAPGYPTFVFRGTAEELAGRMRLHGMEFIQISEYKGNMYIAAQDMLLRMVLFVTGKEPQ